MQLELIPISQVWIYSFIRDGETLYVGQCRHPSRREATHRWKYPGRYDNAQFRTLRSCRSDKASRLERQIIAAYKKRGQCVFNKRLPLDSEDFDKRQLSWPLATHVFIDGFKFESQAAAARYYGSCVTTLKKHFREGNPRIKICV